jgi:transcription elongation GreA/GreB family factor
MNSSSQEVIVLSKMIQVPRRSDEVSMLVQLLHFLIHTNKEKIVYVIVGSQEASILDNKISNESPLGKSMIGKSVGDTITFTAPSGKKEYSILEAK